MKNLPKIFLMPAIIVFLYTLISCEDILNRCIDGNGIYASETRNLESFSKIQVYGDFRVRIDTGRVASAIVETDENLMDQVVTHVTGNQLFIETRNNNCLRPSHPVEITVITPSANEIGLYGSGSIDCSGLEADALAVLLEGSGHIACDNIISAAVSVDLDGSGVISISGTVSDSDLKLLGSGYIEAGHLYSDVCSAYISGSGRIDARASERLEVTIIGSGTVYYWGNPGVLETYISGSGKVIKQ